MRFILKYINLICLLINAIEFLECSIVRERDPNINFYISEEELDRTVGISAELFYVHRGVFRRNAMAYSFALQPRVSTLHFNWQSYHKVTYAIKFSMEGDGAVTPSMNISSSGLVPLQPSVFQVKFHCQPLYRLPSSDLHLLMTITLDGGKDSIEVRRHRFCFNGLVKERQGPGQSGLVAAGLVVVAILAFLLYIVLRCWQPTKMPVEPALPAEWNQAFLPSHATLHSSFQLQELEGAPEDVLLEDVLLEGTFGRVHRGVMGEELVLVKVVDPDRAEAAQAEVFLQEALRFLPLPPICPQLLRPLPPTPDGKVVYPGGPLSNLQHYLSSARGKGSVQQVLVQMALDILSALDFLHSHTVVHRDLATRNCWIRDEVGDVVLADEALSRDLFPWAYHCLGDNSNRPIKWMPPESLTHNVFTPATDMWMFGVVLWELLTLGKEPFAEMDPEEMEWYLRDGLELPRPLICPEELFLMMRSCFALDPAFRPTAPSLLVRLQDFASTLHQFI